MGNFFSSVLSRKRPSPESSDDEKTKGVSDSVFQRGDNAKRAKLWISSDALLQSLPMELIECILVKAVAMEVMDMKLSKSVWKEKSDLVINRLSAVSPQWSNILTSNFFRNELHRTLDRTAEKKIRFEILHQFPLQSNYVTSITTTKDEIFLLCYPQDDELQVIHVHDRDNMEVVKDVIPLPGITVHSIAACRVSNSIYVLSEEIISYNVLRISKDDQGQFNISPLMNDLHMPYGNLSVTGNGGLILSTFVPRTGITGPTGIAVSMYNANGSFQHDIWSSKERPTSRGIVRKSNGNLIVLACNDRHRTKLMEIGMAGTVLRQYQTSFFMLAISLRQIDKYGRMWLSDYNDRVQLLDSEFNPLDSTFTQLVEEVAIRPHLLHYNSERDEVVTILGDDLDLTICRFTDE